MNWEPVDADMVEGVHVVMLRHRETGAELHSVPVERWQAFATYADTMTEHYLIAAHWTDGGPDNPEIEEADFSWEAEHQAARECAAFFSENARLLEAWPAEQAGHDFWLTRNGHGAGFWDREGLPNGDALTEAADTAGSRDLYVGDDGLLYFA